MPNSPLSTLFVFKELNNNKSFVLSAVNKDGNDIQYASDAMKKDKDVALAAIKQCKNAFHFIDTTLLLKDIDISLYAISKGLTIKDIYEKINLKHLKTDDEIVYAALTNNCLNRDNYTFATPTQLLLFANIDNDKASSVLKIPNIEQNEDFKKLAKKLYEKGKIQSESLKNWIENQHSLEDEKNKPFYKKYPISLATTIAVSVTLAVFTSGFFLLPLIVGISLGFIPLSAITAGLGIVSGIYAAQKLKTTTNNKVIQKKLVEGKWNNIKIKVDEKIKKINQLMTLTNTPDKLSEKEVNNLPPIVEYYIKSKNDISKSPIAYLKSLMSNSDNNKSNEENIIKFLNRAITDKTMGIFIKRHLDLIFNTILKFNPTRIDGKQNLLFNESNIRWIIGNMLQYTQRPSVEHSFTLLHALFELSNKPWFSQKIIDNLRSNDDLSSLNKSICILERLGLLEQHVFEKLLTFNNLDGLSCFLQNFLSHRIDRWEYLRFLSADNLQKILTTEPCHPLITDRGTELLARLPNHLIDIDPYGRENNAAILWRRLFEILDTATQQADATQETLLNTLEAFINERLNEDQRYRADFEFYNPENDGRANINYSQSTHNTFVEKSVAESAIKLKTRYQEHLTPEKVEENLKALLLYIESLSGEEGTKSWDEQAVQNFAARIKTKDFILYHTNKGSELTIEKLLSVIWAAIDDESAYREGVTKDDLLKRLASHFTQIQRDGKKEGRDLPICAGGTFNKLVEILNGFHIDVEIIFISKKMATLKLSVCVKESLDNYLIHQKTTLSPKIFNTLLVELEEKGVESSGLWSKIKPKVEKAMDDFNQSGLFQSKSEYLAFIDFGKEADISTILKKHKPLQTEAFDSKKFNIGSEQSKTTPTRKVHTKEQRRLSTKTIESYLQRVRKEGPISARKLLKGINEEKEAKNNLISNPLAKN